MKTTLTLFLALQGFYCSFTVVTGNETIRFKFKLKGLLYSGIGVVSDDQNNLCCTISLLQSVGNRVLLPQEAIDELSQFADRFSGDDPLSFANLTEGKIAPIMIENDPFKEENSAWAKAELFKTEKIKQTPLTFEFRRSAPKTCIFKLTLNDIPYYGTAEVVADRGAISYFVPKSVKYMVGDSAPDFNDFVRMLSETSAKLFEISISHNNSIEGSDVSNESKKWIPVGICKVSLATYTRVFYTYLLGSVKLKTVDDNGKDSAGIKSVRISRVGPPNVDQFAFLSIPLEWTGFLSLDLFPTDVSELTNNRTKQILISLGDSWWHLNILDTDYFYPMISSCVAIIVPTQSENILLQINHNRSEYLGYVSKGPHHSSDPELLRLNVPKSEILIPPQLKLFHTNNEGDKKLLELKVAQNHLTVMHSFSALYNFESHAFKSKKLKWTAIYFETIDFSIGDDVAFYYKVEQIRFKFQLSKICYSGVAEVIDTESQLSFTITRLDVGEMVVGPEESNVTLSKLTAKFRRDNPSATLKDLSNGQVSPTLIPNDLFKNEDFEWTNITFVDVHPATNNTTLTFVFQRKDPRFCSFKVTLSDVAYYGSAEVVGDKGAVSYFVPKKAYHSKSKAQLDINAFDDELNKATPELLSISICHTYAYQLDSIEGKSEWLAIDVRKITSATYTRVFYNYPLGPTQFKIVDTKAQNPQDPNAKFESVKVSRISQPNMEQFSFLSIPLAWSGYLSFNFHELTTDVVEQLKLPTKKVLIRVEDIWWQIKWLNEWKFRPLALQFVAIIVPPQSENLLLRLQDNDDKNKQYFGYVLKCVTSDPELLCLRVGKSKTSPLTKLGLVKTDYEGKKDMFEFANKDNYLSTLAIQNLEKDAFKFSRLEGTPIYIEDADFTGSDFVTLYYRLPKREMAVLFRLVIDRMGKLVVVNGTVEIDRIESPMQQISTALTPVGWKGHLSLTGFDSNGREDLQNLVQFSKHISISIDRNWYLLTQIHTKLTWSLDSSFKGFIDGRNNERHVVMIRRGSTEYFGCVSTPLPGGAYKRTLNINIRHGSEPNLLDLRRDNPMKGSLMNTPLTNVGDIQCAALTYTFERENIAKDNIILSPIYIELLEENENQIKMTYTEPVILAVEVLVVDDLSLPIETNLKKEHLKAKLLSYNPLNAKSFEFETSAASNEFADTMASNTKVLELIDSTKIHETDLEKVIEGHGGVYLFVKSSSNQYIRFIASWKYLGSGIKLTGDFEYTFDETVEFKIKKDSTEIIGKLRVTRAKGSQQKNLLAHAPDGWEGDLVLSSMSVSGGVVIASSEIFRNCATAQISIFIDKNWWLLEKVDRMVSWCLDNSFVAIVVAKNVKNWILTIRYERVDYYAFISEQDENSLKIKADEDGKSRFCKNFPDGRECLTDLKMREDLVKEISISAIAFQDFEYKSFAVEKLNWEQIFIESIEVTVDENIASIYYAKKEETTVPFVLKVDGETTEGNVTVVKSVTDNPKFSGVDASAGWNGRLNLIAFNNEKEPQRYETALRKSDAQFFIVLGDVQYLLKFFPRTTLSIQGAIDCRRVEKKILMVRYNEADYYAYLLKQDDQSLKIKADVNEKFRLCKNTPDGREWLEDVKTPGTLVGKLYFSAIALQEFEYKCFAAEKLTWDQIFIEDIELRPKLNLTDDANIASIHYTKKEQKTVPFFLILGQTTTKGNVTVVKSMSDNPKLSVVDASTGWNGRLSLIAFKNEKGLQKIETEVRNSNAQFFIELEDVYYLLKISPETTLSIQGIIDARYVQNRVLVISVGEETKRNYYGLFVEVQEGDTFTLKIETKGEDLALYVDGPKGNSTENLLSSKTQVQEINHASIALQNFERNHFTSTELIWTKVWIQSLLPDPHKKYVVMTYRKPEAYYVYVVYEGVSDIDGDRPQLPNQVKVRSPYPAKEVLSTGQQASCEQSKSEVILELQNNPAFSENAIIGENAQLKMFLRHEGSNRVTGWRRIVLNSTHMENQFKLIGNIQALESSLSIIFWVKQKDTQDSQVYLLTGKIDEVNTTIKIDTAAVARPFNLSLKKMEQGTIAWKECLRSKIARDKYTFGMHRNTEEFTMEMSMELKIRQTNLGAHSIFDKNDPVLIEYK